MFYIFYFINEIIANQNYLIPSYYGSREQDFLLRKSILLGNLSSFYWHPCITKSDEEQKFYMAYKNAIFEIDSSNISMNQENRSRVIAGEFNGNGSYRDGESSTSRFNNIKSLIYFSKNESEAQKEYTKQTIILLSNSTTCLQVDSTNFTLCEDTTIDPIDPYKIKDVYTERSLLSQEKTEFLFIVDSGNHCIRKIDLQKKITSTYAGICGQKGFKDGMLGVNQFSNPDQMGIDVLGNIFVNDFDNHFIRIISPDGYVKTLISGSCRQDVRYEDLVLGDLKMKRVICLKNWIKTSGQPSTHLVVQDYNICTQHITDCQ